MNGKSLQKWMKDLLTAKKLNPDNWLYVINPPRELHFQHRATGRIWVLQVKKRAN